MRLCRYEHDRTGHGGIPQGDVAYPLGDVAYPLGGDPLGGDPYGPPGGEDVGRAAARPRS